MHYTLDNLIQLLRLERSRSRELKAQVDALKEAFEQNNKEILSLQKESIDRVKVTEDKIREEAFLVYQNDPERKKDVHDFLKERDIIEFSYSDTSALEWCKAHDLYLIYDKKGFEAFLRSLKGKGLPSFVTTRVKETITISTDL